ncbi:uncharacterized protein [Euphorbia lathyris]|uniref:uncharacterized protein isoform X2 n=1 Tax=Euphorbia lathyris TaxID=212925 RepID=UPI003314366C
MSVTTYSMKTPYERHNLHKGPENNEVNVQDQDPRGARDGGIFLVRVDAGGNLQPSHKASQHIKDSVMMHPHPLGYCFKTVPPNVVQLYWKEFQKQCTWDNNRYNSNQVSMLL